MIFHLAVLYGAPLCVRYPAKALYVLHFIIPQQSCEVDLLFVPSFEIRKWRLGA